MFEKTQSRGDENDGGRLDLQISPDNRFLAKRGKGPKEVTEGVPEGYREFRVGDKRYRVFASDAGGFIGFERAQGKIDELNANEQNGRWRLPTREENDGILGLHGELLKDDYHAFWTSDLYDNSDGSYQQDDYHYVIDPDGEYEYLVDSSAANLILVFEEGEPAEVPEVASEVTEVTSSSTPEGFRDFEMDGKVYRFSGEDDFCGLERAKSKLSSMTAVDGKEWRLPRTDELDNIVKVFESSTMRSQDYAVYWTEEPYHNEFTYGHTVSVIAAHKGELSRLAASASAFSLFILD